MANDLFSSIQFVSVFASLALRYARRIGLKDDEIMTIRRDENSDLMMENMENMWKDLLLKRKRLTDCPSEKLASRMLRTQGKSLYVLEDVEPSTFHSRELEFIRYTLPGDKGEYSDAEHATSPILFDHTGEVWCRGEELRKQGVSLHANLGLVDCKRALCHPRKLVRPETDVDRCCVYFTGTLAISDEGELFIPYIISELDSFPEWKFGWDSINDVYSGDGGYSFLPRIRSRVQSAL